MAEERIQIPVFMPGSDRDFEKVEALATVTDDGQINIRLANPEAAITLVQMARTGALYQMAIDYRVTDEMIKVINERYKDKITKQYPKAD